MSSCLSWAKIIVLENISLNLNGSLCSIMCINIDSEMAQVELGRKGVC